MDTGSWGEKSVIYYLLCFRCLVIGKMVSN